MTPWRGVTPWGRRLQGALLAVLLLTAGVALLLPREVERQVWRSELDADRATLTGLVSAVEVPPEGPTDLAALDAFAHEALLRGDYVRVKLWSPDGTILYSDATELIGSRFPLTGALAIAAGGTASDTVSRLDRDENQTERGLAGRVLEVYVPVTIDGEVVAVWEIYRSLDRFDAAMTRVRWIVWLSVGGALALLLLVLTGLVGTLLSSLQRRGAEATAVSVQLGTLLAVSREVSRSLDSAELACAAVEVVREEAGFTGVGLLRRSDDHSGTREVVALSLAGRCPSSSCIQEGCVGLVEHDHDCHTLGVEVPAGEHGLVLVACRPAQVPFTGADEVVLRAAGESIAMAWDNARLYEALSRSEAKQRQLTRKLVDAHEDERRAIVGDIHDGLGQDLHRVLFGVRRAMEDPHGARAELARLEELVEISIADLRRVLRALSTTTLQDLGLLPALRSLVATTNDDGDGEMTVELRTDDLPDLELSARLAIYRIIQEALHNARKHGHALKATVHLTVEEHWLVARVEDDGCGYAPVDTDGLGIWLMRERAAGLGGQLCVQRVDGGTSVEARIPIGVAGRAA